MPSNGLTSCSALSWYPKAILTPLSFNFFAICHAMLWSLATPKTIKERLFEAPMKEAGVDIILPSEADQKMITNIISRLISNRARKKDSTGILKIIRRLRDNGAEAVVIGCTDISLLISDKNSAIPVIETVRILEDSVIKMLLHGKMPK